MSHAIDCTTVAFASVGLAVSLAFFARDMYRRPFAAYAVLTMALTLWGSIENLEHWSHTFLPYRRMIAASVAALVPFWAIWRQRKE